MAKSLSNEQRRGNGEGYIVYDEKNDRWIGQIRYNGKRKYFYSEKGGKRSTVVRKMDDWKKSVNKESSMTRKIHLDERLTDWLVTIKKPALKPSSYDRLEQTVNLQLIPRLGDCELKDITDQLIKTQLIDKMLEEDYSISTTKKAYDAMHDFLNYAIYRRLITFHPMAMMKPPKPVGYEDADPDDEEGETDQGGITVLNAEERQAVREMAAFRWKSGHKDLRYPMGWAFVLIMNTGLRMGEALALKWTDVDLEAKELRVTKNAVVIKNRAKEGPKQKLVVQNTPKSKKSRRVIPLNQEAVNALTQLKARPGTKEDGYIIHTADGSPMLPRNFEASLTLLCKASNIRPIGVHALRHTFATRLYEKGVDVKVISELLGHSSVDITYRIYIHVFEQSKRSAIQVLDLD